MPPGPRNRELMVRGATTGRGSLRGTRFALAKFRLPALPATLITRSVLHERLAAGAGRRNRLGQKAWNTGR